MTAESPVRILLVGAGAVGLVYANYLERDNKKVQITVLARSNYNALKSDGAEITVLTTPPTVSVYKPYQVFEWSEETISTFDRENEAFDYVVVATKSLGNQALQGLQNFMQPGKTLLVLFQNGIEIEKPYLETYPGIPIVSAVVRVAASSDGVRKAELYPSGMRVIAGLTHEYKGQPQLEAKLSQLQNLSLAGGEMKEFSVTSCIEAARWEKMLWNGSFNMLASILDLDTGGLLEAGLERMLRDMMLEIWQVAQAILARDSPGDWPPKSKIDDIMVWTIKAVPKTFVPSTLQDVRKGNQIEIEAIMGNAIRAADREKVPVPTLKNVYSLLSAVNYRLKTKSSA